MEEEDRNRLRQVVEDQGCGRLKHILSMRGPPQVTRIDIVAEENYIQLVGKFGSSP